MASASLTSDLAQQIPDSDQCDARNEAVPDEHVLRPSPLRSISISDQADASSREFDCSCSTSSVAEEAHRCEDLKKRPALPALRACTPYPPSSQDHGPQSLRDSSTRASSSASELATPGKRLNLRKGSHGRAQETSSYVLEPEALDKAFGRMRVESALSLVPREQRLSFPNAQSEEVDVALAGGVDRIAAMKLATEQSILREQHAQFSLQCKDAQQRQQQQKQQQQVSCSAGATPTASTPASAAPTITWPVFNSSEEDAEVRESPSQAARIVGILRPGQQTLVNVAIFVDSGGQDRWLRLHEGSGWVRASSNGETGGIAEAQEWEVGRWRYEVLEGPIELRLGPTAAYAARNGNVLRTGDTAVASVRCKILGQRFLGLEVGGWALQHEGSKEILGMLQDMNSAHVC